MIVRIWRGRARSDRSGDYPAHFERAATPRYAGFVDAQLLQRLDGDVTEFTVITRWRDRAAVVAFAGDDPERAVVEPDAVAALVSFDGTRHHEARLTVSAGPA